MARQSDIKEFSEAGLTKLLKNYWLVTDDSPMMKVIDRVVKAKAEGRKVKFLLRDKSDFGLKKTLDSIGVENEVFPPGEDSDRKLIVSADIPALHERNSDFSLLLPFHIQRWFLNGKTRREAAGYRFETDWIVLVQYLLEQGYELEDIIDSWLASAENGFIACHVSGSDDTEDFRRGFYHRLRSLPPVALAYLGLTPYPWPDPVKSSWLNQIAFDTSNRELIKLKPTRTEQKFVDAFEGTAYASDPYAPYDEDGKMLPCPKCDKDQFANLTAIGQVAANLYRLSTGASLPDEAKVREYFNLRLFDQKEEKAIRQQLGMRTVIALHAFLKANYISLENTDPEMTPQRVYKRWEEARDALGLQVEDKSDKPYKEIVKFFEDGNVITLNENKHQTNKKQFLLIRFLVERFPKHFTWHEIDSELDFRDVQLADLFRTKGGEDLRRIFVVTIKSPTDKAGRGDAYKANLTETKPLTSTKSQQSP